MTRKWRIISWSIYTLGALGILMIAFNLKISISLSIIIGFICGLMNEIIQWLIKLARHFLTEEEFKK